MGELFGTVRRLVKSGRYVVGQHATEQLDERRILEWQIVEGIADGTLIVERPSAVPNPAIEVRQCLADGTPVKAVWSYIVSVEVAKLVTVHFFDR